MERRAPIPAWVARRSWNRRNPAWVRAWLDRKPKADRSGEPAAEAPTPTATILRFPRDSDRP